MKKLITAREVQECKNAGRCKMYVDKNTIITPAARDAAMEKDIAFVVGEEELVKEMEVLPVSKKIDEKQQSESVEEKVVQKLSGEEKDIDVDLIYKIVKEVLAQSMGEAIKRSFEKECDSSGLKLIRGNTVQCERFETGNPDAKVGLTDVVNTKESPNMGAGFMTIEKSSFDWELCYEEFDYIVEGTLDITINGKTYNGKAGDVFFIPKNSKITWSTPDFARFFYITYPANWAEIAANK